MIDPATCRAARGLLNWTQRQLADASGVGHSTIVAWETGRSNMLGPNLAAIERALWDAGVEVVTRDGAPVGVQFRGNR